MAASHHPAQRLGKIHRSRGIAPLLLKELRHHIFVDHGGRTGAVGCAVVFAESQAGRLAQRSSHDPAEHLKQNRLRAFDAFLWGWAAVLLLFFSALRHKEARYVMPLAPPLFLLAGMA